jgi:HEAT repeat protein
MRAEIEQAKWAVRLVVHEHPPGCLPSQDDARVLWSEVDVYLALRGFASDLILDGLDARCQAVEALGWLGDPRGVSPLLRGLLDRSVEVRRLAAIGVAQFALLPEWTVDPLGRALRDEDVTVRDGVATALGRCRCFGALEAAAEALDDVASSVRASAANALRELGEHGYRSNRIAWKLSALLDDPTPRVAYDAFWALRWQAGSASDERCSGWRWSIAGATAWQQAISG